MAVQTITYGDKSYLNQNADIPATNKVQDSDMNEIKAVVNNNANETDTNSTNISTNSTNILKLQTYSTNEINTEKIWIDGNPIYRKVLTLTTPSTTGSWVTIGNLSYETIIDFYGTIVGSDGRYVSLNHGEPDYEVVTSIKGQEIQVKTSATAWTSKAITIIVEYTKAG